MATTSRRTCALVALLLLLSCFSTVRANSDAPYAVTFGPSSITVSRFTSSRGYEESRFPAGKEYTGYFEHVLLNHRYKVMRHGTWFHQGGEDVEEAPPDTYDGNATTALFLKALKSVSKTLNSQLGHDPTYAALVLPPFFDSTSEKAAISVLNKDGPYIFARLDNSACFAYGLELCRNQGRTATECQDEDSLTNLNLIVNYEKKYLYLALDETYSEYYTFPPIFGELSKEFGEESGRSAREAAEVEYTQHLQNHFIEFINKALSSNSFGFERDEIRTIVFVGEASRNAFASLRKIAYESIGHRHVKIWDNIDPARVVAQGAAKYAQLTVLRPDLWGLGSHDDEAFEHDEL